MGSSVDIDTVSDVVCATLRVVGSANMFPWSPLSLKRLQSARVVVCGFSITCTRSSPRDQIVERGCYI